MGHSSSPRVAPLFGRGISGTSPPITFFFKAIGLDNFPVAAGASPEKEKEEVSLEALCDSALPRDLLAVSRAIVSSFGLMVSCSPFSLTSSLLKGVDFSCWSSNRGLGGYPYLTSNLETDVFSIIREIRSVIVASSARVMVLCPAGARRRRRIPAIFAFAWK